MRPVQCLAVSLLALALASTALAELRIVGPSTMKRDALVELKADGVADGAAVLWDVFPEGAASIKEGGNWIVFNGPPGVYSVRAMSISAKDGKVTVERARHSVTIEGSTVPPVPPPIPPTPPPTPPGKALSAIVKVQFGTAGCTATLIGGLKHKVQLALTAAHCVKGVGQTGTATLKDGRTFAVRVVTLDRGPDVAWLEVDTRGASVPQAYLADSEPEINTRIWHSGYGVDKPGNREDGTVIGRPNSQGQLVYRLSVSPGDSGGGMITDATDRVLSPVCCTTCLGCVGTVYGGSVAAVRATLPPVTASSSFTSVPCCGGDAPPVLPAIRTALPKGLMHPILNVVPDARLPREAKHATLYYPVRDLVPGEVSTPSPGR